MEKSFEINALQLKILAMVFMLCDHTWATGVLGNDWLTCVGRLAFPIFAFQIAEGYALTGDPKAYRRRLFLWALISEIPFNLMAGGRPIYPFHQNVMFTFWLSLLVLGRIDRARKRGGVLGALAVVGWTTIGFFAGTLLMVDYFGYGVLMVVLFYLTRDLRWGKLIQLAVIYYLNAELMGGLVYPVELLGREWLISQQGFAVLALVFIWLYNGKQGPYNRTIRRMCYAFYPAHILILSLIGMFVLN